MRPPSSARDRFSSERAQRDLARPPSAPRPRVSIRGARACFVGPALQLAPHRNAVAVVAVALDAPFELAQVDRDATPSGYVARELALIAPGQRHHLRARGPMAFVYLDALSDEHAALAGADPAGLARAAREAALAGGSVDALCDALGLSRKAPVDARIAALLCAIDERPESFARLEQAARQVGVSPSRCRALIQQCAGVPFRRYRLWRRFASVMRALAEGRSLTESAMAAGFASSAHVSAAFKAMFGLAPSTLVKLGVEFDLDDSGPYR